jgi:hypothetical protein
MGATICNGTTRYFQPGWLAVIDYLWIEASCFFVFWVVDFVATYWIRQIFKMLK